MSESVYEVQVSAENSEVLRLLCNHVVQRHLYSRGIETDKSREDVREKDPGVFGWM